MGAMGKQRLPVLFNPSNTGKRCLPMAHNLAPKRMALGLGRLEATSSSQ